MDLTKEQCQKIIFNAAIKLGCSPKLITTRLLDDQDKVDMKVGLIDIVALECHIEAFMASGMPDYAHGSIETYEEEKKRLINVEQINQRKEGFVYHKSFVEHRSID